MTSSDQKVFQLQNSIMTLLILYIRCRPNQDSSQVQCGLSSRVQFRAGVSFEIQWSVLLWCWQIKCCGWYYGKCNNVSRIEIFRIQILEKHVFSLLYISQSLPLLHRKCNTKLQVDSDISKELSKGFCLYFCGIVISGRISAIQKRLVKLTNIL